MKKASYVWGFLYRIATPYAGTQLLVYGYRIVMPTAVDNCVWGILYAIDSHAYFTIVVFYLFPPSPYE